MIVCGCEDGMIYIFESRQSTLMHEHKAHTGWINTATYSSDGK